MSGRWLILLMTVSVLTACSDPGTGTSRSRADNLAELGGQLFFDTRLGADGRTSCATCHAPEHAFTDGKPTSVGAYGRMGTRNAPSLLDVGIAETFFWDGRETDLGAVVLQPFVNPVELGHATLEDAIAQVRATPEYRDGFRNATGRPDPSPGDVARALVAYLNSLDRGVSRYERAVATDDPSLLDEDEKAGLQLFQGKAQCAACHVVDADRHAFTDNRFHHAGIGFDRIAGNLSALLRRIEDLERKHAPLGQLVLEDAEIAELGRFVTSRKPQDLGAFRTPTLRNVANTAPYMHDGSIATLEEAIERELYYRGISLGRSINLTVEEQRQLAAFLRSLSIE